jgi:hypothetical protein
VEARDVEELLRRGRDGLCGRGIEHGHSSLLVK